MRSAVPENAVAPATSLALNAPPTAKDIEQHGHSSSHCPCSVKRPRLAGCTCFVCTALSLFIAWVVWYISPRAPSVAAVQTISISGNYTRVYVGMGCFWELQWATTRLELSLFARCTGGDGPTFVNPWNATDGSCVAASVTSKVGYAGGTGGLGGGGRVCYRCGLGCQDDYDHLGHAEVVQVALETPQLEQQFRALADAFFHEFTGPDGARARPDQTMDRGAEYRSVVGWPGGRSSPLWPIFERANVHGMELRAGSGDDADLLNVVWVMDSDLYPFFAGEEFHRASAGLDRCLSLLPMPLTHPDFAGSRSALWPRTEFHSNFFPSPGMPYPSTYIHGLRRAQIEARIIGPTGCPEERHWR